MPRISGLTDKQTKVKQEHDRKAQAYIRDAFGNEAVAYAKDRLCRTCSVRGCEYLPLTTKGEDCPYHKKEENVS